jgi:hypothetical protein
MIGNVIEKTSETLKPIIINKNGFPQPKRISYPSKKANNQLKQMVSQQETSSNHKVPVDFNDIDYETKNLQIILSMTEEEREEAISEISQVLSKSSIDFLMKKNVSTKVIESVQSKLSVSESASVVDRLETVNSEEELMKLVEKAPKELKASLEWIHGNQNNKENKNKPSLNSNVDSTSGFRMTQDRFDLKGRKVVKKDSVTSQIFDLIKSSHPFLELDKKGIDQIYQIMNRYVMGLLNIQYFVHPPPIDNQPQHELFNHQFDQNVPGYNMIEISEVIIYLFLL